MKSRLDLAESLEDWDSINNCPDIGIELLKCIALGCTVSGVVLILTLWISQVIL